MSAFRLLLGRHTASKTASLSRIKAVSPPRVDEQIGCHFRTLLRFKKIDNFRLESGVVRPPTSDIGTSDLNHG